MLETQPLGQGAELGRRLPGLRVRPGALQFVAREAALTLRQVVEDVAPLVGVMPTSA